MRQAPGLTNGYNIGDTLYGEMEFQADASGFSATEFSLYLYGVPGSAVFRAGDLIRVNDATGNVGYVAAGIFRTPPIAIVAGCTNLDLTVNFKESGTIRLARGALKRV